MVQCLQMNSGIRVRNHELTEYSFSFRYGPIGPLIYKMSRGPQRSPGSRVGPTETEYYALYNIANMSLC